MGDSSCIPDPDTCGRSNLSKASRLADWFTWFLDIFLSRLREADSEERQEELIIGGAEAAIEEAPWVVRVVGQFPNGPQICTGNIIDDRHILTAAHCIKDGSVCSR